MWFNFLRSWETVNKMIEGAGRAWSVHVEFLPCLKIGSFASRENTMLKLSLRLAEKWEKPYS